MTIIEFFEKDALENICTALIAAPERVVLVGDGRKKKAMEKSAAIYGKILGAHGKSVAFECRTPGGNDVGDDLDAIVALLSDIVEENDDCAFDLTGGDDFFLVAAGIIYERYKDTDKRIQMHRVNVRNNRVSDGDEDKSRVISGEKAPWLSAEELIRIYGGKVIYEDEKPEKTIRWDMNDAFKKDIKRIWELCSRDTWSWNVGISVLGALDSDPEQLEFTVPESRIKADIDRKSKEYYVERDDKSREGINNACFNAFKRQMEELRDNDRYLLKSYSYDAAAKEFSFSFKNSQVKRCLTVAGQALEMIVYLAALELRDEKGEKIYDDVKNGVHIDWDGEIHTGKDSNDTENEIDVILMRDMVPIFVSCKNGRIENEELYKLNTVASRFGGKYAKKVLVASESLTTRKKPAYFRSRAHDMGIKLYPEKGGRPLSELSFEEIKAVVRDFVK